jgi:hypothetical protein
VTRVDRYGGRVLTSRLVEQEFVAHLFAPVQDAAAVRQLAQVWAAGAAQLAMTRPLRGLSARFPVDPAALPAGVLAGIGDPAEAFRALLRHEPGLLSLSLLMSAPPVKRGRGVAAGTPPGWWEFSRWWGQLTVGGIGALAGSATLYLAKARNATGEDVVANLPPRDDDAAGWWTQGTVVRDFPVWEVTPRGDRPERRIVVLAAPGDSRLGRFAWAAGDDGLPPLGRYLAHAAELRRLARTGTTGREPGLESARATARAAEIASAEMSRALSALLPADAALAGRLAAEFAAGPAELKPAPVPGSPSAPARPVSAAVEQRVGFGIDVVSYSRRSTPAQTAVQQRVAGMVERVLDGLGLAVHDTDRQDAGDGMMVVLPARIQAHQALAGLLNGWQAEVAADNAGHAGDPIRLRLAVGAGPFTPAAIGFSGNTMIEIGRLLDSEVLRSAVVDHPSAGLVALISDRLHADVVGEGYPGLDPDHFADHPVRVKDYQRDAWLWLGGAEPVRAPAWPVVVRRAVFVLHGGDERLRRAVFELLRGLDLRPVDWSRLVARAAEESPDQGWLLQQAFTAHQAAVVVIKVDHERAGDLELLVRAGMARGQQPSRTVVLEIGGTRPVAGLGAVVLDGSPQSFEEVAERLAAAGCELKIDDPDWQDPTRFAGLALPLP